MITDVYGAPLPSTMTFSTTAPLGPEATGSGNGSDGPSDGTIIGAVIGSFLGACLIALAFVLLYRWRRFNKGRKVKTKYEEVVAEPSSLQLSH